MKIEDLKAIAARRTPGEWKWGDDYLNWLAPGVIEASADGSFAAPVECNKEDKVFIAMAANNIDKLIAVAEVARRTIEEGLWIDGKIYVPELDMTNRERLAKALDALESEN